jgi:hypothetical protein
MKRLRGPLIYLLVFGALLIQWRAALDIYFVNHDEWDLFIEFEKPRNIISIAGWIFEPLLNHFFPVFKSFFFLQFKLFGTNPLPYHVVSIALFAATALLLFRFLEGELSDGYVSFCASAFYAVNTAYFSIVSWAVCQHFTLTVIFLLLALLEASKGISRGRTSNMLLSGLFCMLSSLSMTMGAASWLFVYIYYVMKRKSATLEEGHKEGLFATLVPSGTYPLLISAAVSFLLYRTLSNNAIHHIGSMMTINPFLLLKGSAIVLGDTILASLGVFAISNAAAKYLQIGAASMVPFHKALIFVALAAAMGLSAALFRKLGPSGKAIALTGFSIMTISAVILVFVTGRYSEFNFYDLTRYSRYKYFPFLGLIILVAPLFCRLRASLGPRFTVPFAVLVVTGALLHMQIFSTIASADPVRQAMMKKIMSAVEASVRYPMAREPERFLRSLTASTKDVHHLQMRLPPDALAPLVIDSYEKASRTFEDIALLDKRGRYIDLLHLFKEKDDIITDFGGKTLLLKVHEKLRPAEFGQDGSPPGVTYGKNALRVESASHVLLPLPGGKAGEPTGFQHLVFRMKADGDSTGRLYYSTGGEKERTETFGIRKGRLSYTRYVLPCPSGKGLRLQLPAGEYTIKDIRLYR